MTACVHVTQDRSHQFCYCVLVRLTIEMRAIAHRMFQPRPLSVVTINDPDENTMVPIQGIHVVYAKKQKGKR